ncbi:MAG: ribonuclease III [Acidobacteria bacterium]|nr:ribonuclease III [Acidobacteriota bacterium]MBI3658048.1 ribonuclease III [Acidobacteriota bacterium]
MHNYEIDPERLKLLYELESDIDYKFRNIGLLDQALTHKSFVYENDTSVYHDNESLEFLGDAVMGFISSAELFIRYPDMSEGKLSKVKAFLVSSASLVKRSQALQVGKYIRLGYGEEKSGGREKRAILVDTYEALVAAIYLDGGIHQAEVFVRREFFSITSMFNLEEVTYTDYKSTLQERLHILHLPEPHYHTVDELGPDHRKTFVVEVSIHRVIIARAEGRTKKEAQQEAARLALENIKSQPELFSRIAETAGSTNAKPPSIPGEVE